MKLSLVVLAAGTQEGKTLEIKVPQFLIGRDPQCHLRPSSPMISKRHCALIVKDGKVYLKDFGSTNGSFVNEQPVKNAVQLKNGDKLKIGPLHFEVRLEVGSATDQPTPAPAAAAGKPAAQASKPAQAAKPAPVQQGAAKPVPAGQSSPPPSTSDPQSDDEIAAMLLSGPGDETVSDGPAAKDDIPQGTTVFDLPATNPGEPGKEGEPGKDDKTKKDDKTPKAAPPIAPDSRSAAAVILEQMRKRPRS